MSSKRQIGRARVFHLQNHSLIKTENDFWAVQITFFQMHPNAIHFNPLQFCPSMCLLGFLVFYLWVLLKFWGINFDILVNPMTIWSVLKLSKIVWPGLFYLSNTNSFKGFIPRPCALSWNRHRVQNCDQLVASVTVNWVLPATRILRLFAIRQPTLTLRVANWKKWGLVWNKKLLWS